jgi:tripartite ATP-independent transporter DctM subunit
MSLELLVFLITVTMFVLLAIGMHIGFAMALSGFLGMLVMISPDAALSLLGQTVFETALSFELSVIPLFVLMGFFATSSGLSEELYEAFDIWLGSKPGGLGMATVAACGGFGAICGSSLATAATMSQVALPQMRRYGYNESLATGVIAAGGTIGILIPPSVIMVLYGILTETSIGDLFLAGIIPGLILVMLFLLTVWIMVRLKPELGPPGGTSTATEKIRALRKVWGIILLFAIVLGGIYLGVFTPTEAAGIGATGAWLLGLVTGKMTKKVFVDALLETVKTTAIIFTILIGAIIFKNFMALSQAPKMIESLMNSLSLPPMGMMLVILLIYIILGAVLDTMAMILLTIPIFFPLITALGFDPVWFGIIIVVVVELALISPPMGINVFVIKGMVPDIALSTIYKGVLPFVVAQILLLALLLIYPKLVMWLPGKAI